MPRVRFIITGFGPFPGVPDNPTQRLLQGSVGGGGDGDEPSARRPPPPPGSLAAALPPALAARVAATAVLPVSAAAARAWAAANATTTTTASDDGATTTVTVFVHLGVNADHSHAGGFALEARAANCAQFRVPDVDGARHGGCPVEEGVSPEAARVTGLPLEALAARLEASGWAWKKGEEGGGGGGGGGGAQPWWDWWSRRARTERTRTPPTPPKPHVRISVDAGRYLCNFLYFLSLGACEAEGGGGECGCDGGGGGAGTRARRHALFVHVPPAEVVPLVDQAAFLAALLQAIVDEVEGEGGVADALEKL
jgi:pyrrolidone-carboxylate peptidase